jgi:hypothetical protein
MDLPRGEGQEINTDLRSRLWQGKGKGPRQLPDAWKAGEAVRQRAAFRSILGTKPTVAALLSASWVLFRIPGWHLQESYTEAAQGRAASFSSFVLAPQALAEPPVPTPDQLVDALNGPRAAK